MSKRVRLVVNNCGAYEDGRCVLGHFGGSPSPMLCLNACKHATPIDGTMPVASMVEVAEQPKLSADEVSVCSREESQFTPDGWAKLKAALIRWDGYRMIVPRSVYAAATDAGCASG